MTDELTPMLMAGRQTRACVMCGATFSRRSTGRDAGKCCSQRCGWAYQAQRARSRMHITAEVRVYRRWAEVAKMRAKRTPCATCGKPSAGVTCSAKACAYPYYKAQRAAVRGVLVHTCRVCERTFETDYGDKRRLICSKRCSNKLERQRGGKHPRKRARHHGVDYEPVDRLKVFDRDGWRCQVCGSRTPRRLMGGTSDRAPELDHRVPMAMGGGHTYLNCQLACRKCNNLKGHTRIVGQQPLFSTPPRRV